MVAYKSKDGRDVVVDDDRFRLQEMTEILPNDGGDTSKFENTYPH